MNDPVLPLITALRQSHPAMVEVFTQGACLHLFHILRTVFPEARAYLKSEEHVITRIGYSYYDINGRVSPRDSSPLEGFSRNTIKQLWKTQ